MTDINDRFSKKNLMFSFFCSILVMMIHTTNLQAYSITNGIVYYIEIIVTNFIAPIAVPFFFINSGFWLYSKKRSSIDVFKSRFKSLVLPYILWNIIFMIAFYILTYCGLSKVGVINNLCDVLMGVFFYKYNYVFWFMHQLIILTFLYPLFNKIFSTKKISMLIIIFLILITTFIGDNTSSYLLIRSSLIYYSIGLFLGKFYYQEMKNNNNINNIKSWMLFIVSSLIFTLQMIYKSSIIIDLSIIRNLALLIFIYNNFNIFFNSKIRKIYYISFFIYSLHSIVLEVIEKIIYLVLPHSAFFALVDYLLAPLITLAIIYVIALIIKKTKLFYLLNGQRNLQK